MHVERECIVSLECRDTSFRVSGPMCVFTVVNSEDYNLRFVCVCVWGPTLSGYMSLSTPSRTCRRRVSSCMRPGSDQGQQPTFSRKLASKQLALRVSPDKQMVTVCTQGECYQTVINSQAAICPPYRSQGEEKKALSLPSPNTHPIKSCIWFSFHWVPWGAHAIRLCKCHSIFSLLLYLFTRVFLCYSVSPPSCVFYLTAVQMTCCPSCPSWLCGASVLSWCLNVLLWRNSFMKGESPWWKKDGGWRSPIVFNRYTKKLPE